MNQLAKRARWKRHEREIAAELGGTREPVSGRQRGDVPDIKHALYSIEVKSRKSLPKWIREAMAQAEAAKRDWHRIAIVVLHEGRTTHADDLVVLSLGDWKDWFGVLPPG